PFAGVLEQILVQEDETVEVGTDLAIIGSGEGAGAAPAEEAPAAAEAPAAETPAPAEEAPAQEPPAPAAEAPAAEAPAQEAPAAAPAASGDGQPVKMPALGESVTEGTVTRWLKSVGEEVAVDEPLLEVSTDKVDTEIPSPVAGTLTQILVQEDETVEVGTDLAIIGGSGAAPQAEAAPAAEPQAEA